MRNAEEAIVWSGLVPALCGGVHEQIRALYIGGTLRTLLPRLLCEAWLYQPPVNLPACATAVHSTLKRPRVGRA